MIVANLIRAFVTIYEAVSAMRAAIACRGLDGGREGDQGRAVLRREGNRSARLLAEPHSREALPNFGEIVVPADLAALEGDL